MEADLGSYEAQRRFYAQLVTARGGVTDQRIVRAFEQVPREQFVGPGPWRVFLGDQRLPTETDDPVALYQDVLVSLAQDRGINNGEPSLHASCIQAASPQNGDVIIHVGAGTGYYTAILARLAGSSGLVEAYEIEPDVAARAAENLADYPNVKVHAQSVFDARLPPANVIYVNAGATRVPVEWLDSLAIGGRLVMPLTPDTGLGVMILITRRSDSAFAAGIVSPVAFIACIGARSDGESRMLARSLRDRQASDVRSLRRGGTPDESAWHVGSGWWLSTAEPQ